MTVTGMSYERASRAHIDELRRQAFLVAQRRQLPQRPLARVAASLRRLAARLEHPRDEAAGPWRDDFWPKARRA